MAGERGGFREKWQPANHVERTLVDYARVFDAVYEQDPSRLIFPNAFMLRVSKSEITLRDQDKTLPFWTHPKLALGTMEMTTGYSKNWRELSHLPIGGTEEFLKVKEAVGGELRAEYLKSPTHAWFDFENEESIGQPNWKFHRGKPTTGSIPTSGTTTRAPSAGC